jgi:hypothetical protein
LCACESIVDKRCRSITRARGSGGQISCGHGVVRVQPKIIGPGGAESKGRQQFYIKWVFPAGVVPTVRVLLGTGVAAEGTIKRAVSRKDGYAPSATFQL